MHLTAKTCPTPKVRQSGGIVDAELIHKSMVLIVEIGFADLQCRRYFLARLLYEVVDYTQISD